MLCLISEVVPILLRRVKQDEPRGEDKAPVEDEIVVVVGREDEIVVVVGREDVPVDDADEPVDDDDEPLGESAGGCSYKLKIKFCEVAVLLVLPLLGLFGRIRATSPKFITSCDDCPDEPTLPLSAANMLCVVTGFTGAALGKA
jgi:hypothetical protein